MAGTRMYLRRNKVKLERLGERLVEGPGVVEGVARGVGACWRGWGW